MNLARKSLSMLLLLPLVSVPALADFKYTDTSQITGGGLKTMRLGVNCLRSAFLNDNHQSGSPERGTSFQS